MLISQRKVFPSPSTLSERVKTCYTAKLANENCRYKNFYVMTLVLEEHIQKWLTAFLSHHSFGSRVSPGCLPSKYKLNDNLCL